MMSLRNIIILLLISSKGLSQCPLPNVVIASEVFLTHSEVIISWNKNPSATKYYLDVSLDASSFDSSSILTDYRNYNTVDDSIYVKGLIKNTTYYYRIRSWSAGCGYGNYTYDSFTTSATANCFYQDTISCGFEDSEGWRSIYFPFWSFTDINGHLYSSFLVGATGGNAYNGNRKIEFWFAGSEFELPVSYNPSSLSFYARTSQSSSMNHSLNIQYYNGSSWITQSTVNIASSSYSKYQVHFNLTGSFRIRIQCNQRYRFIYLDNIELVGSQTYLPGNGFTFNQVLHDSTSFGLNWDRIPDANGYFIDVSTDSGFANYIEGYIHKYVTDTNLNVNPLSCSNYYVRIRSARDYCAGNNSDIFKLKRVPDKYNLTGGGGYCMGSKGINIGLNNSETGHTYYLLLNDTSRVLQSPGTGGVLNFVNVTNAGTYKIISENNESKCSEYMNNSKQIIIWPLPGIQRIKHF